MNLSRIRFFSRQHFFCKVFQQAFLTNPEPGGPSRRHLSLLAAFLAVCAVPLLLADAAQGTALTSSPSTVSFGSVAVGAKNTQTLAVKNTSTTGITVTVASIAGSGFTISSLPLPFYLGVGSTTYFAVGFAPTSSGTFSGTLTLKNINSALVLSVGLSGSGAGSSKSLVASTSTLNFGNETVGESTTLAVALINTGTSSVTISGFSLSNTSYSVTGGLTGATLAAGQRAILNIVFAPKSTGSFSGSVTVVSNATNTAPKIAVSGTGISDTSHSVGLSWSPSTSSGVVGYNIYRSTVSGSSFSRLNSSPTTSTKYTDGNVVSDETYYYVVTAVNSSGAESVKSSQITAVIP
jgi:Abnormal spindle-like microcephaly-assoc'd, ASPM-SPD-2-Hydin/HYDIN/CFA65/VesB-like, Ig-like domain